MAVLLIPGCGAPTAEMVDYVHQPTAQLHETYDVSPAAYGPFKVAEVVLAPRFVAADHSHTAIKLIAASATAAPLTIHGVRLRGAGGAPRSWTEVHTVELRHNAAPDVFKGYATFATVPNAELDALAAGGPLTLDLDVRSGEIERSVSFEIVQKTRTYLATP